MRKWKTFIAGVAAIGAVSALTGNTLASSSNPAAGSVPNLGVLDVEAMNFMSNFNPFSPNRLGGSSMIYEPLLIINALNGDVTPWLATQSAWTNGGRTLTFKIRHGVSWSDGTPFTAADVVYTYQLLKKFPSLDSNGLWSILSDVSQSGSDKVVMTLKRADYLMFSALVETPIVPQHIWSKQKNPVTWTDSSPVGTGPYTLQSLNSNQYVLAKNPKYWQPGIPVVNTLTYYAVPSNQTAQLDLISGKLDWTSVFFLNIKGTFADRDPAHNKFWLPPSTPNALYLNLTQYPFNLVQFRQALAYAIDKNAIDVKGEGGYEPPASATEIVLPYDKSYLDTAVDKAYSYTYNPQRAKAILKSAGFKWNAQGRLVDPKGKVVTFKLEVPTGWTDYVEDSNIISDELKQMGISVQVYTPSVSTYYSDMGNGTYQAAIQAPNGGSDPGLAFYNTFDSTMSAPIGKSAASNYERWINKQTDALIQQYSVAGNLAQQKKILDQLQAQVAANLPIIPLNYSPAFVEYRTDKVVGWPDDHNPYANSAPWSYPGALITVTKLRSAH